MVFSMLRYLYLGTILVEIKICFSFGEIFLDKWRLGYLLSSIHLVIRHLMTTQIGREKNVEITGKK